MLDVHSCSRLDPYLERANKKYIKLNDEECKQNIKIVLEVVHGIINQLKEKDSRFRKVFQELTYCGSFFDGLRVNGAVEFDMNLILDPQIPLKVEFLQGEHLNLRRAPGHCIPEEIKGWFDQMGYLKQNLLNNWFQSVIDRNFFGGHSYSCKGYTLDFTTAYPARTLKITGGNLKIDVDLVPAFRFRGNIPKLSHRLQHNEWVAIPKQDNWRATYPEEEKELLSIGGHLLYIGRLLKGFNESTDLGLRSYYIKTLLLHEAAEVKEGRKQTSFWQNSPGYLFLYMLNKLENALQRRSLLGFWKSHDEFAHLNSVRLDDMYRKLKRINEDLTTAVRFNQSCDLERITNRIFRL